MRGPGRRAPVGRRSFRHSTVRAKGRCGTLRDADVVPFGTCGGQGEGKCHGAGLRSRGHRRTAGTRRAPQHAPPLWGQRLSLLSGRGQPASFARVGEVCGAAGVASRRLLGLCHGAGRGGRNGHHPSGMAGERHSCLAAEAKPCKSHDGGGGTAPCRGEKGGCHARCT